LEHHRGLHVLELRDAALEFHVHAHGAGNGAHGARPHAVPPRGLERGFAQPRVRGEAQVVVGGEVDNFLAIKSAAATGRRLGKFWDDVELLVFERLQV